MPQIVVPTLGESVSEATVARWLKKEGETVKADEPLVELETDKVTLEVNAPQGGTITKITVGEGATVKVGAVLGELGQSSEGGSAANDTKATAPAAKPEAPKFDKPPETPVKTSTDGGAQAGPAARKAAADAGVDISNQTGSGKDGRVTKADMHGMTSGDAGTVPPQQAVGTHQVAGGDKPQSAAPRPEVSKTVSPRDASPREERVKMTRLRQRIAARLKEAQNTAAMLTTFNEVDMTAVMEARNAYKDVFEKKHKVKLGFMSFFVKAAVGALREFPAVNAEIDGDEIIYKNYYDIGVAVSTPQGLIVPVVRDCAGKSMAEVEKTIGDLGARGRDGKLAMDELTGGTFTITNGGTFGSLMSTPIINPPQSAILGMHKIQQRAMVMPDGSIKARPMMYLALSYDHRIIDGREAVSFLVRIKDAIEDPQRLVLDI